MTHSPALDAQSPLESSAPRLDPDSAAAMGSRPGAVAPALSSGILSFAGPEGEYVSQGKPWSLGNPVQRRGAVAGSLEFEAPGPDGSGWSLSLASPDGKALQAGSYPQARRAAFHGDAPGLSLSGAGRGCNQVFGSFSILEIERDDEGAVVKIAVDFEQRGEAESSPAAHGSLRIASSIPPLSALA